MHASIVVGAGLTPALFYEKRRLIQLMYPLASYMILKVLDEERIGRMEDVCQRVSLAQQHRPTARSLALSLGHAFIAMGNRLEHFGQ